MKTYAGWRGSLNQYLQVGDVVDEEMVDYFINVLPPLTHQSHCIQMGEPYSCVNGKNTYSTLSKTEEGWVYAGNCHRGQTKEPVPLIRAGKLFSDYELAKAYIQCHNNGCKHIALVSKDDYSNNVYEADEVYEFDVIPEPDYHKLSAILALQTKYVAGGYIQKAGTVYKDPAFCIVYDPAIHVPSEKQKEFERNFVK